MAALAPQRITFKPQIHSSSDQDRRAVSILVQGRGGTGKTHFMVTCPGPFFLIWDTNLATHYKFPDLPFVQVQSWEEVEDYWLDAIKKRRLTEIVQSFQSADGTKPFQSYKVETLCLDSLTFFANQTLLELAEGHAKMKRSYWDEYYSRFHRLVSAACGSTFLDNAHPDRECYNVVASIHEEDRFESIKVGDEWQRRLLGTFPTVAGKMANQLDTYFSTHLLCDVSEKMGPGGKVRNHLLKTITQGSRRCKPDQVGGGSRWKTLPESMSNTWQALSVGWGMVDERNP